MQQEDNSLAEKILCDVESIINSDDQLKEFSVVPVPENEKNKSPVLYEEHNLGLEMWCIKHVYKYSHDYLLKVRDQLAKNRLSQSQMAKLHRLLTGAVLIQPDVSTFWNMRRELMENNAVDPDKELLLTKLVLSHKSKSNEAFSHRRWIVKFLLKNIEGDDAEASRSILENELAVTETAAQKAQNNYHAWTHRIWAVKNITSPLTMAVIVFRELDFSFDWIFFNVSEHAGFHYRQRLFSFLRNCNAQDVCFSGYRNYVKEYLNISSNLNVLEKLFGPDFGVADKLKFYQNYFCVVLFELVHTLDKLNRSFPAHESIWYHRRFVIYTLLQGAYEYFGVSWQHAVRIDDSAVTKDQNIVNVDLGSSFVDSKSKENGEKYPKLFKSEPAFIESSPFYKMLVKVESKFFSVNSDATNGVVQIELARRHKIWLTSILGINLDD